MADAATLAPAGQPPHLTLMHLLMSADTEEAARRRLADALASATGAELRRLETVEALWSRLPAAWELLSSVLAEARHDAGAPSASAAVEAWTRTFDRLAAHAPEAGVALYALGDPALLQSASREVVDALVQWGDLRPGLRVLDLGCGIGRLSGLMAAAGAEVLGVDVSLGMLREARQRCTGPRTHFARLSGHDLAALADDAFDLVLAVDVFPYLVLAGEGVAGGHIREIGRVLRPGGRLVLANLSYRGDERKDDGDLGRWLQQSGMRLLGDPMRPFAQWDGLVFRAERTPA